MADRKDIEIGIKTTADTSGIEKTDAGIQRLKTRSVDDIQSVTDKVGIAQWGFYDLDAEIGKTHRTTETFTSGITKLERPVRNNAQALLLFSQGFEDAQYGIRGVLNNVPGLILAMGGGAGLAGAISIAAVGGSVLFDWLTKSEEKSTELAERMTKVAGAIGDAEIDRFQDIGTAIQTAAGWAEALEQNWDATKIAENKYASDAITNAEKLAKAQQLIAESLGLQVDRFRELEQLAVREAERRRIATEQAIAEERRKEEAAQREVTRLGDAATAQATRLAIEQANLVNLRGELQLLRDQVSEAEKLKRSATNPGLGASIATLGPLAAAGNTGSTAAAKKVASPEFQQNLAITQQRVDRLEAAIRELSDPGGIVEQTEIAFEKAKTKLADVSRSVEIEIDRISEGAAFDDTLAKAENLARAGEVFAQELTATFGQVQTNSAAGQAAKAAIEKAAADGKITLDETQKVAEATRTLIGLLQSGQAAIDSNLQTLIRLQQSFLETQKLQAAKIQSLQQRR